MWRGRYRYSWDADDANRHRLTRILLIVNKINLRQSACSELSASGNINLTHPHITYEILFILFLFFKYFQSVFQEFDIVGNTFVECIRRAERFAFGIQQDVERLGVCTEFAALQITPLVLPCSSIVIGCGSFVLSSTIRVIRT